MKDDKKKLLFIGPLTDNHGQGIVTLNTYNILKKYYNIFSINIHIKNLKQEIY